MPVLTLFAVASFAATSPKLSTQAVPDFINAEGKKVHLAGEASEHCLLRKYVPKTTTGVLELGVRWATSTCALSHHLLPRTGVIVSVEADANAHQTAARNMATNGCVTNLVKGVIGTRPMVKSQRNNGHKPGSTKDDRATTTFEQAPDDVASAAQLVPAHAPADLARAFNLSKGFDTLVADCEGCLDGVLRDFPEFVASLDTIIVEADYGKGWQPQGYVDYNALTTKLFSFGFVISEAFYHPCCAAWFAGTGSIPMYVFQKLSELPRLFPRKHTACY